MLQLVDTWLPQQPQHFFRHYNESRHVAQAALARVVHFFPSPVVVSASEVPCVGGGSLDMIRGVEYLPCSPRGPVAQLVRVHA
jgi:hypothetical protein